MKRSLLALSILLAGCQVKNTGPGSQPPPAATPAAFPLVVHGQGFLRAGERFQGERGGREIPALVVDAQGNLARFSSLNLRPGKENAILIRISDSTLVPQNVSAITKVEYDMPTMPEMGGPFEATLAKKSDHEVEATLDIAHGGYWEVRLHKNGKEAFRVGIDVPQGGRPR